MSENLTLLGNKNTIYKDDYAPEVLETFDNKHLENDYFVKFNCPEFTSLCPITGQPDFATIYISYVPNKKMVESKSLKLYFNVCVKLALALLILIVVALPIFPSAQVILEARGIVVSVTVPLALPL